MNYANKLKILQAAHQEYVEHTHSVGMSGVAFSIFLRYLLAFPQEKFFDKYIGTKIHALKTTAFKLFILDILISGKGIVKHELNIIPENE